MSNRTQFLSVLVLLALATTFSGCSDKEEISDAPASTSNATTTTKKTVQKTRENIVQSPATKNKRPVRGTPQPDTIRVRFAVVGHEGTANVFGLDRSAAQAQEFAEVILQRFKDGVEKNVMLREFKDSKYGPMATGIYTICNFGKAPNPPQPMVIPREKQKQMSAVAFGLEVGQFAIVPADLNDPLCIGVWVIKRIQ